MKTSCLQVEKAHLSVLPFSVCDITNVASMCGTSDTMSQHCFCSSLVNSKQTWLVPEKLKYITIRFLDQLASSLEVPFKNFLMVKFCSRERDCYIPGVYLPCIFWSHKTSCYWEAFLTFKSVLGRWEGSKVALYKYINYRVHTYKVFNNILLMTSELFMGVHSTLKSSWRVCIAMSHAACVTSNHSSRRTNHRHTLTTETQLASKICIWISAYPPEITHTQVTVLGLKRGWRQLLQVQGSVDFEMVTFPTRLCQIHLPFWCVHTNAMNYPFHTSVISMWILTS